MIQKLAKIDFEMMLTKRMTLSSGDEIDDASKGPERDSARNEKESKGKLKNGREGDHHGHQWPTLNQSRKSGPKVVGGHG